MVGTPNEYTSLGGMPNIPIADQMKFYDVWGSDLTYPHMAVAWTWAFDTPFKWTKQVASFFGGTRQGMAMSWPGHIPAGGGVRTQFHHMIDITPTILEATGIQAPVDRERRGPAPDRGRQHGLHAGPRTAPTSSRTATTQYFEMFGNRALYHDGWIAVTVPPAPPWLMGQAKMPEVVNGYPWELYHIDEDYSENNNLAAANPAKLKELQELFLVEAAKYNVFPLDNQILERILTPRPECHRRPDRVHLHRRPGRDSAQRRAQRPDPVVHHHRRRHGAQGWRQRDGGHGRRPVRRVGLLRPQGEAGLHLRPGRPGAVPLGRRQGARRPGKHTLKSSTSPTRAPASARGATGCCRWTGPRCRPCPCPPPSRS